MDDPDRLLELCGTGLLDSPTEEAFDRFTRLVVQALGVPVSLVSLVDGERQFFKSAVGLPEPWASRRETGLSHSFCQHVVTGNAPLLVEDARADARVVDNLAVRDLSVIGYAGVPIHGPSGLPVGALCAITHEPRMWTRADVRLLQDLAAAASELITMRARAVAQRTAVTDLSHHLRTGLTALQLEAGELRAAAPDGESGARVTHLLETLVSHSRILDESLRQAAHAEVAHEAEVDLADLLARAALRAAPAAQSLSRQVQVAAADRRITVVAPETELSRLVDGIVGLLLEHGRGDIRLELVVGPSTLRVRASDESNGLPAEVSSELSRRNDSALAPGEPSLAERAALCRGRLVQTSSARTTLDLVLPRA